MRASPAAKDTPSRGVAGVEYVGFWTRLGAQVIDAIVVWFAAAVFGLTALISTWFLLLSVISIILIPIMIYGVYKHLKCQTLGRRLLGIMVVDDSGEPVGFWKGALREIIGKAVCTVLLSLGFVWVAFDRNKQGWHDKIAGTYVVRRNSTSKHRSP